VGVRVGFGVAVGRTVATGVLADGEGEDDKGPTDGWTATSLAEALPATLRAGRPVSPRTLPPGSPARSPAPSASAATARIAAAATAASRRSVAPDGAARQRRRDATVGPLMDVAACGRSTDSAEAGRDG
jgi:hypothetical protein